MTADELIASFRQRADDRESPYLVSDEDAFRFATEGEREACLRAKLIWDETSSFLSFPAVAGQAVYPINPLIDRIERVTFTPTTGKAFDLCLTGMDAIAERYREQQDGKPELAAQFGSTLRLWPAPNAYATGTITLSCYRFPLFAMEAGSDEPEIPAEHHEGLVDWMLFRTYYAKDSETFDPGRAAQSLAMFERKFGERPSADVLRRHREHRRVTTRFAGI